MSRIDLRAEARRLERRIDKGSELLWQLEQAGDDREQWPAIEAAFDVTINEHSYERWIQPWPQIVGDYDAVTKHILLSGKREVTA